MTLHVRLGAPVTLSNYNAPRISRRDCREITFSFETRPGQERTMNSKDASSRSLQLWSATRNRRELSGESSPYKRLKKSINSVNE